MIRNYGVRRPSRSLFTLLMGILLRQGNGWIVLPSPVSSFSASQGFSSRSTQTTRFPHQRHKATRLCSLRLDGEYVDDPKKQKAGKPWHRVLTKLLRRREEASQEAEGSGSQRRSSRLRMTRRSDDQANVLLLETAPSTLDGSTPPLERLEYSSNDTDITELLRQNFHTMTPHDLHLSPESQTYLLNKHRAAPPSSTTTSPKKKKRKTRRATNSITKKQGPLLTKWARQWVQKFMTGLIRRLAVVPPQGLQVLASPRILPLLRRGQLRFDTVVKFDRVVFPNIRLSGGGTLETKKLVLNLLAFGAPSLFRRGAPRFARAFEIHAHNCTLTQDDLLESSCIRDGLARLLKRILTNAGVTTAQVQVTNVEILSSNKISCAGVATTPFGSRTNFEVRSGLGTASRGHILTFPGLEVSLQPMLGVFMPVVPDISLDIGHNARLRDVVLDVKRRRATLDASVTVTPDHTRVLPNHYRQTRDSYLAQYAFDVGRWVTHIGNFAK